MKLTVRIDQVFSEEEVVIQAPKTSDTIDRLCDFIQDLDKKEQLNVKKEGETYLIKTGAIDRLYIENRKVHLELGKETYTSNLRLYEILEHLPTSFLQISQSEVINIQKINHLKQSPNGLVHIFMKNGSETYSSRRYLKSIKEKLEL